MKHWLFRWCIRRFEVALALDHYRRATFWSRLGCRLLGVDLSWH